MRLNELLDNHEATTDTNDESAIEHLSKDLASTEHIEAITQALNGNWTAGLIDVITEQLIQHVSFLTCEELGRLFVFALLNYRFMEEVNLLVADFKLSFDLSYIGFTCLHELIKLVDMLSKHVFLILHVANVLPVAFSCARQITNLLVKRQQLAILSKFHAAKTAKLTICTDLLVQGCTAIIDRLRDFLSDRLNIGHLLFEIISHPVILRTSLLKSRS